jgi:hypothetical protein
LRGSSFVYNVRDVYPDIAIANGGVRNRFLLALLKWANDFAYANADLIIVLGEECRSDEWSVCPPQGRGARQKLAEGNKLPECGTESAAGTLERNAGREDATSR